MKKKNVAGRSIVLFVIMLSLTTLACGFLTGDDETAEPADSTTAVENQDTLQEPGVEPAIVEPAAPKETAATEADQPVTEEESDPVDSDEGPSENGELSSVFRPTPLEEIQAMQIIMVSENLDSGEVLEAAYSFIRPDRYLTNLVGLETLAIGETGYMKIDGAEWTEQPLLPGAITVNVVEETARAFVETAAIYKLLEDPSGSNLALAGEETINGVDTLVYTFDGGLTSPLSGIIHGQITVWLGKTDGLLYRQTVVNSTDSGLGPRSSATVDIVYGDAVTIKGPE
jgi:hypothetical protein